MKNLLYLLIFSTFLIASCAKQEKTPLTDAEKEKLKSEVAARVDEITAGANEMDLEAMKEIYWNDPSFLAVSFDKIFDYESYIKDTEEIWSGMSMLNFQEDNKQIIILDDQTAYAVYDAGAEGKNQEGQLMKIEDFYASMLWRKVDGIWKVAGTHESGVFVMPEQDSVAMPADSTMVE